MAGSGCLAEEPTIDTDEQESLFFGGGVVYEPLPLIDIVSRMSWRMQPRASQARAAYLGNDQYDSDYLYPDFWHVNFDACGSSATGVAITNYVWHFEGLDGIDFEATRTTSDCELPALDPSDSSYDAPGCKPPYDMPACDFDPDQPPPPTLAPTFPSEGRYRVTLTAETSSGISHTSEEIIDIDDILVIAIGDSMSSGEGLPENGYWWDARCHRSFRAAPAAAAKLLDGQLPHKSVTFVSHACSGARTEHLVNDPQKSGRKPQVQAARDTVCGGADCSGARDVDVVIMSAGINDLSFSGLLAACTKPGGDGCDEQTDNRFGWLSSFPDKYTSVADELLDRLGPHHVFTLEYPVNMLNDVDEDSATGGYELDGCGIMQAISQTEGEKLFELGNQLNAHVRNASNAHGWRYVGGVVNAFWGHGYCSDDKWIRTFADSFESQGNKDGMVHPDEDGALAIARLAVGRMLELLESRPDTIPEWPARRIGGGGHDLIRSVVQDDAGNVYIAGEFSGTAVIEGRPITSKNGEDGFVGKLSPAGDLIWLRPIGSTGDAAVMDIALTADGDIVSTGVFSGTLSLPLHAPITANGSDSFLVKLDRVDGTPISQNWITGNDEQLARGVAVDSGGRIAITGYFKTSIGIPDALGDWMTRPGDQTFDCFLVWLDPNTTAIDLHTMGGSGYCAARDVAFDRNGNLFVTGRFDGHVSLAGDGGWELSNEGGSGDMFVAKYSAVGSYLWDVYIGGVNYFGGSGNAGGGYAWEVDTDADGHAYVLGHGSGSLSVTASDGVSSMMTLESTADTFVVELDGDGQHIDHRMVGGSDADFFYGIDVRDDGSYAIVGRTNSPALEIDGVALCKKGIYDAVVATFHPDHELRWARRYGSEGKTHALTVDYADDGTTITGGHFDGQMKLDDDTLLDAEGGKDGFVTRVDGHELPFPTGSETCLVDEIR